VDFDKVKRLNLLKEILSDFQTNYTWNFRKKLKRSINKLQQEVQLRDRR